MGTYFKTVEDALQERKWYVVDAADQVVGRLASKIARVLRGKHKPYFAPYMDAGDFVVVVNADKVRFTGNKLQDKKYHHHTGFIGSVKTRSAADLMASSPEEILRKAVQGMLPKTPLGRSQLTKLKIYSGSEHPHSAQRPEALPIEQSSVN